VIVVPPDRIEAAKLPPLPPASVRSTEHALVGALTSGFATRVLFRHAARPPKLALWAFGTILSVAVDLDHFVVARLKTGSWDSLRAVLAEPRAAVLGDQEWIFADAPPMATARLRSHAALTVALALLCLAARRTRVAVFTTAVLAVHVGCDLLRDREIV
jgi:hypothetical protein